MLRKITLLRDKVTDWTAYPFSVPAIRKLEELELRSQVCFFAGENGSGKSTLLEAIAAHYGFGREGGTRSFLNNSAPGNHSIEPLVKALRLAFTVRTGRDSSCGRRVYSTSRAGLTTRTRRQPGPIRRRLAPLTAAAVSTAVRMARPSLRSWI
jgi:hypothetical protein